MRLDIHKATKVEELHLSRGATRVAEIVLSEKNLLSMLCKLYQPGSGRTVYNNVVKVDGELQDDLVLKLVSEPDDEHYNDTDRGGAQGWAGVMVGSTEAFIQKLRVFLEEHKEEIANTPSL